MSAFSSFSKSAFWSQFLLGIMAIFALPAVSNIENQLENQSVTVQQVLTIDFASLKKADTEQALFLQHTEALHFTFQPQAVEFCAFFAKPYCLLSFSQPPIRAGPIFLV